MFRLAANLIRVTTASGVMGLSDWEFMRAAKQWEGNGRDAEAPFR
jgi:hypothetical protein